MNRVELSIAGDEARPLEEWAAERIGRSTFRVIVPIDYKGRAVSRLMRAIVPPPGLSL